MSLHEWKNIAPHAHRMEVPGGWVYCFQGNGAEAHVFVPFSEKKEEGKPKSNGLPMRNGTQENLIAAVKAAKNLALEVDMVGAGLIDSEFEVSNIEDAFEEFRKTLERLENV